MVRDGQSWGLLLKAVPPPRKLQEFGGHDMRPGVGRTRGEHPHAPEGTATMAPGIHELIPGPIRPPKGWFVGSP